MKLSDIHLYTECLALLVALFSVNRIWRGMLIWFVPYLAFIVSTELLSRFMHHNYPDYSMGWVYNCMNLINQGFYSFVFYRYATGTPHKKLIVALFSLFMIYSLFFFLSNSFFKFGSQAVAIGGMVQVVLACMFFYSYLKNDEHIAQTHYTSGVWIAAGVLIFYAGTSLVFSLLEYIRENSLTLGGEPLYRIIPRYLSAILYTCIGIALIIWKKPERKL